MNKMTTKEVDDIVGVLMKSDEDQPEKIIKKNILVGTIFDTGMYFTPVKWYPKTKKLKLEDEDGLIHTIKIGPLGDSRWSLTDDNIIEIETDKKIAVGFDTEDDSINIGGAWFGVTKILKISKPMSGFNFMAELRAL